MTGRMIGVMGLLVVATGCKSAEPTKASSGTKEAEVPYPAPAPEEGQAVAMFASGCFWCSEKDFEALEGVDEVLSGYAGGWKQDPTYREVGSGATGHTEAIRVLYDPDEVTYDQLLHHFWRHVDPFDHDGQFCDRGSQYRPALFPVDEAQRRAAKMSKDEVEGLLGRPVLVQLEEAGTFWVAEAYHQDFYKKNPGHYERYRTGCGRDARVASIWAGVEGDGR